MDESQITIASKLAQLNLEKSNFKPLMNVRIKNVQLASNNR